MIGTLLDFDPEKGGLLRGTDGGRYAFEAAEWKGKAAAETGARIDFEPNGEMARSLYPVPAPAAPLQSFVTERPGLLIALLLLVACGLPFLTLGPFSANLFNVVGVASSLGRYAPVNVNIETGLWLFHGLYIVPVAALALLLLEWRGLAGRWWRIGTGLVALVAPVAIALGARALFTPAAQPASLTGRLLRRVREQVAPDLGVPGIGIGWIAIAVLSAVLIAVGIFWSRSRGNSAEAKV